MISQKAESSAGASQTPSEQVSTEQPQEQPVCVTPWPLCFPDGRKNGLPPAPSCQQEAPQHMERKVVKIATCSRLGSLHVGELRTSVESGVLSSCHEMRAEEEKTVCRRVYRPAVEPFAQVTSFYMHLLHRLHRISY